MALALVLGAFWSVGPATSQPATEHYTCVMHPEVASSGPGTCPVCAMDLVPASPQRETPEATTYACPMHPAEQASEPGFCPICGMALMAAAPDPPEVSYGRDQAGGVTVAQEALRELLQWALENDDVELRLAAIPGVVDATVIRALLDDEDAWVRSTAAIELGLRGDHASTEALRRAAEHATGDPQMLARLSALQALLWLGDDAAIGDARRLLASEQPLVRHLTAMMAASHPGLIPDLRRLVEDPEPEVRWSAQSTLARLGDPDAVAAVTRVWHHQTFAIHAARDPQGTRDRLLEAIGGAGGACRLDETLLTAIEAASVLLERIEEQAGREALHNMLTTCATAETVEASWLGAVLSALTSRAAAQDLAVVVPYLASEDPVVRTHAAAFTARVLFGVRYRVEP